MLSSRIAYDTAVQSGSHSLTGASTHRYSITFFPSPTAAVCLSNEPSVVFGQGLCLLAGGTPVTLNLHDHGDCVQREWYVLYSGALSPMAFLESIMCGEKNPRRANEVSTRDGGYG